MTRAVVITGAGSGIGLAVAIEAAHLGFRAVAAVHRPEQVSGVLAAAAEAGVDVDAEVLDVTDDAATAALLDEVEPWAVVASAGYMNVGLIEDVPIDDARRQLDVMLLAPARLVRRHRRRQPTHPLVRPDLAGPGRTVPPHARLGIGCPPRPLGGP